MIDDPIVEDVYQARRKILDECHGDLSIWMESLRAAEVRHRDRVVTLQEVQERRQSQESEESAP